MKNISFIVTLLFISIILHAKQTSDTPKGINVITLPDYYKQKGIVFTEAYDLKIDIGNIKKRFTPSIDEIKKAEDIFFRDYAVVTKQNIDTKKYFYNYLRQYVGYIDCFGNKNLMMQIIDNSKPGKMHRILGKNWEKRYMVYLSDKSPFSYIVLTVDLNKEQILKK